MGRAHSIGRDAAIALFETRWWESATDDEIVRVQLWTRELCMDFGRFHQAMEAVLGRPVWTHEFAEWGHLQDEVEGKVAAPSFDEIVAMIPEGKRIVIVIPDPEQPPAGGEG
jgi:hypothetical protein